MVSYLQRKDYWQGSKNRGVKRRFNQRWREDIQKKFDEQAGRIPTPGPTIEEIETTALPGSTAIVKTKPAQKAFPRPKFILTPGPGLQ
jgi:hypothetical protein